MKYTTSNRKELTILKIEEEVFDFRHADAFKEAIDSIVNKEGNKNLIVDFSQVKAIDSCGISSILIAHQLANQLQGLAIFVSLCKQIKDLLKLTNLDKQLYIFSSINEVMTLIEPAMKHKKGSRGKSPVPAYEAIEELDELDLIAIPELQDEHMTEHLDEHFNTNLVEGDESDEIADQPESSELPDEKEPASKKRGRPKKTDSDNTPKSKKQE